MRINGSGRGILCGSGGGTDLKKAFPNWDTLENQLWDQNEMETMETMETSFNIRLIHQSRKSPEISVLFSRYKKVSRLCSRGDLFCALFQLGSFTVR